MKAPFERLVASSTYEDLVATLDAEQEHTVVDVIADVDATLWDRDTELENLVTLMHQGASEQILDGLAAVRERRLAGDD